MAAPKDDMKIYLEPTAVIDSDHPDIREIALSLTKGLKTDPERAEKIFYFARDKIRYNPYSPFHEEKYYVASTVLKRGYGYCIQKAVLLAALGRAVNIPTRLGFADIRNHQLPKKMLEIQGTDKIYSHGFTELFIGGRWLKATPAFNIEMCDKLGLVLVDFDGKSDGVFPRLDRKGNLSIEYLKDVGNWPDLPLDHILEAFVKLFGKERFELLMKVIDDMGHEGAVKFFGADGGEYP